jgi:trehalose 6-phosphate synthase
MKKPISDHVIQYGQYSVSPYIMAAIKTPKDLTRFVKESLKGRKFIVAFQRETYLHTHTANGIAIENAAGGAHSLLDGILQATGGVMVALATGDADAEVVDKHNRIQVPPGDPKYTLKRVFIKKKELEGFYYGFSNQTLWPLCHAVFVKPIFNNAWWQDYVTVNQKFADAIGEEIDDDNGFIWVNDYHLSLLPTMLRRSHPKLKIGVFWHIPWPTYEIYRICPWRKDIVAGLLGADFIGFHRGYHVDNFVECARRDLEVIVDTEPRSITYKEHTTKVANVPAGIDYTEIMQEIGNKKPTKRMIEQAFGFSYERLGIGVDRIDYTKGIPERLKIIDRFFEKYPDFLGKFTYLLIGAPSRVHIPAYKAINHEISDLIEKINWKYGNGTWIPIQYVNRLIPRAEIFSYYHLADVCMVTSLDDGMNLVAKEYAICNQSDKGMLLLSKFTGAAKDMKSAMLINPYDIEGSAIALYHALIMDPKEKEKRNTDLKTVVAENNIYEWGIKFIQETMRESG